MATEGLLWDLDHLKEAHSKFALTESKSYLFSPLCHFHLNALTGETKIERFYGKRT